MKKLFLAVLLFSPVGDVFAQQLDFARTQNQVGTEASIKVIHDYSNQLVLTGIRQIIAPSGGTNGASNTWVKKYDTNGMLLWSVETNYTGTVNQQGAQVTGVSVDHENNIYLTGVFLSESITLGGVNYSVPANGNLDLFYAKINSAGVVQWVKGVEESHFGNNICIGSTISVTPDNQLILTGAYFKGIIIGNDTLAGNPALAGGMSPYGFYAKLNSDGTPVWARRFSNLVTGAFNSPSGIGSTAVDEEGNLFFMMGLDSAVVMGNDTISSTSLTTVIKTDSAGNFIRAIIPQSTYNIAKEITLDKCGNVLFLGEFIDSIQLESTTLIAASSRDVFVAKLDNNLDLLWMKQFYSSGGDLSGGIACNDRNDVFFNFEFWGEINYAGPYSPSPLGTMDALLIKLDEDGNYIWHKYTSGPGNTSVSNVSVSPSNKIAMAGRYQGQEQFDGTTINSTPTNLPDVWFASYTDNTLASLPADCEGDLGLSILTADEALIIYPNPASENIKLSFSEEHQSAWVIITDTYGRIMYSGEYEKTQPISLAGFPEGMYIVRMQFENGKSRNGKFVVKL
ncbi:MAG: hypothetical protein K0S23_875 [Fluviicola sp.]|jgi:hypothetical protein|uniref:T9SS type A sorting domain-containing protein n=1 Tax=Fluviicola sp. TaxID=1917219 RepID=UPI00261E0EA1|nr:T9SS type A sorting domain-containing protein [Fluviicola sp.]MDF3026568.1 hypothetical protein [Fluviicola sp.]